MFLEITVFPLAMVVVVVGEAVMSNPISCSPPLPSSPPPLFPYRKNLYCILDSE